MLIDDIKSIDDGCVIIHTKRYITYYAIFYYIFIISLTLSIIFSDYISLHITNGDMYIISSVIIFFLHIYISSNNIINNDIIIKSLRIGGVSALLLKKFNVSLNSCKFDTEYNIENVIKMLEYIDINSLCKRKSRKTEFIDFSRYDGFNYRLFKVKWFEIVGDVIDEYEQEKRIVYINNINNRSV